MKLRPWRGGGRSTMAGSASVVPTSAGTAQPTSPAPAAAGSPGGNAAPASQFNFKAILQEMIRNNASDLHLKVGRPPTLRVQGALAPMVHAAMRPEDLKSLAEQVMTPRQVKEFAENKEADFAIGVTACIAFWQNLAFKAAAVSAASIFLLGDAIGHVRQMMVAGNFAPGNAGVPFYMDVICPALAITLLIIASRRSGKISH